MIIQTACTFAAVSLAQQYGARWRTYCSYRSRTQLSDAAMIRSENFLQVRRNILLVISLLLTSAPVRIAIADTDSCPIRKSIDRPAPEYPHDLRMFGNSGTVIAKLDIAAEGTIQSIEIVLAEHPALERETVKAMRRWTFQPIPQDVKDRCKGAALQKFEYMIVSKNPLPAESQDIRNPKPFSIGKSDMEKLPEPLRYDDPPEVQVALPVLYPIEERLSRKSGSASVAFYIDTSGRVRSIDIKAASTPAFGDALAASMAGWRFKPAMKSGAPSLAVAAFTMKFDEEQRDSLFDLSKPELMRRLINNPSSLPELAELDAMPQKRFSPPPVIDPDYKHAAERIRVDFVIDKEGLVRGAHPVGAGDMRLGMSAATAVSRWQFDAPMKAGQPVEARASIGLRFEAQGGSP